MPMPIDGWTPFSIMNLMVKMIEKQKINTKFGRQKRWMIDRVIVYVCGNQNKNQTKIDLPTKQMTFELKMCRKKVGWNEASHAKKNAN